jgi:hypothetical protein
VNENKAKPAGLFDQETIDKGIQVTKPRKSTCHVQLVTDRLCLWFANQKAKGPRQICG